MSRYTSEELRELAAGYALGAATPEERAAVEEALRDRTPLAAELGAEIAACQAIAASLAESRAVVPSPAVRERFLTVVRAESQTKAPNAAPNAAPTAAPTAAAGPLLRVDRSVVPITDAPSVRGRARSTMWLAAGLAAAVLIAVALGRQNLALRHSLDAGTVALAHVRDSARTRDRQLETVLEAESGLYVAQMTGKDTVAGPGIRFFWNERTHVALLHAFRLKPAPAGRSYQLWFIRDGKPLSAKVFNSDADGHALVEDIALPDRVAGVTQLLLTEEPAGGSPLPTTTPFLGGALAKT